MKEITLPARMHMLVNNIVDTLMPPEEPSALSQKGKNSTSIQNERSDRKDFLYYQPVFDDNTQELVGHLADISYGGFKLDCQKPVAVDQDFRFHLRLSGDVADKPSMVFIARSRWCKVDPLDPCAYNVGYQLVRIAPGDLEIFSRMMEKFGAAKGRGGFDFRRSNKW